MFKLFICLLNMTQRWILLHILKCCLLREPLAFIQIWISKGRESRSGRNFGGHLIFLLMPHQFCPQDRAQMTPLSSWGPSWSGSYLILQPSSLITYYSPKSPWNEGVPAGGINSQILSLLFLTYLYPQFGTSGELWAIYGLLLPVLQNAAYSVYLSARP